MLDGGEGNDILSGDAGNDTYLFGKGDGQDTIHNYDSATDSLDKLLFGADISADQLWFRKVNNHLEISIIGTDDKATISNWYSSAAYRLEQFETRDGALLTDGKVHALVEAMAAFAPPAAGETTLSPGYREALAPVIAANWQ